MNINKIVDNIHNVAVAELEKDKKSFLEMYQRAEPNIQKFIEKFLEWGQDDDQIQWRWEMFHTAFSMESCNLLSNFHSFVANCLLDDSRFEIKWVKPYFDSQRNLVWLPNGDFKVVETTKDDLKARPRVFHTTEGSCDPLLLIKAMDIKRTRELVKLWEQDNWILGKTEQSNTPTIKI